MTLVWLRMMCASSGLVKLLRVLQPEPLFLSPVTVSLRTGYVVSSKESMLGSRPAGQDPDTELLGSI